ncbi:putative effector protein/PR5 protein [Ceratobasidium theobromae]|uniref:Putative effector protein/PR5 protein n=1 Tax=Ceratobasidium theobromae TaxID=1582974 RepID=A0A5N5Q6H2_9AGAM|nr:putative effector protein/PR5 protein [Ceratobasidium theobromae]
MQIHHLACSIRNPIFLLLSCPSLTIHIQHVQTDLHVNTPSTTPNIETGWEAPAGSVRTFTIPEHWRAGRIWGRRNCDFSNNPGPNSCTDGGCNGGLQCDPRSGTGVPPATVAEWTLGDENGLDWYDGG